MQGIDRCANPDVVEVVKAFCRGVLHVVPMCPSQCVLDGGESRHEDGTGERNGLHDIILHRRFPRYSRSSAPEPLCYLIIAGEKLANKQVVGTLFIEGAEDLEDEVRKALRKCRSNENYSLTGEELRTWRWRPKETTSGSEPAIVPDDVHKC